MFWLVAVGMVAVATGYIFDAMSIAVALIILFAIIGLPLIARWESGK